MSNFSARTKSKDERRTLIQRLNLSSSIQYIRQIKTQTELIPFLFPVSLNFGVRVSLYYIHNLLRIHKI